MGRHCASTCLPNPNGQLRVNGAGVTQVGEQAVETRQVNLAACYKLPQVAVFCSMKKAGFVLFF